MQQNEWNDKETHSQFSQQQGQRRGIRHKSASKQKRNNQRMEEYRQKKGIEVREANREKIKEELYAGVEDEFNRLEEAHKSCLQALKMNSID